VDDSRSEKAAEEVASSQRQIERPSLGPGRAVKLASPEEGRLLVRHREGDPSAFAELIERYRAPVFAYLVRCGVDPASRDDLFQDIFLKVHRAADAYRVEQPLHPWVFTIVANSVRSHFRRARVRKLVHLDGAPEEASRDASGQQELEARETAGWVETALAALPAAQREVLILCSVENLAQRDVALALSIPVGTVKTHLRRARLALAGALARRQATLKREVSS